MFVVFDLDGTLALTEHREHFLKREPKDWRRFYGACDADAPCLPLIIVAQTLWNAGHRVEVWSGRSDEVEGKTSAWRELQDIRHIPLKQRPAGDHRPDTVLKAEWLDAEPTPPDLVFEDRSSMVAMYRERGIRCCQVAPGDF